MGVIIFIAVLVVLILSHELGHFWAAKASGVKVEEFGVGFPPRIAAAKWGETVYSFNLLPFGGFVKIYGETPKEELENVADRERTLFAKPKIIQAGVIVAGVIFNLFLAWFLLSVGLLSGLPASLSAFPAGRPAGGGAKLLIVGVLPGSPASLAGIEPGDELIYLQSKKMKVDLAADPRPERVQEFVSSRPGQKIAVGYRRGAVFDSAGTTETKVSEVIPAQKDGKTIIGVSMDTVGVLRLPFFSAAAYGAKLTGQLTVATVKGFFEFIRLAFEGEPVLQAVVGPVGLAGLIGNASKLGLIYLLSFTAIISINLAVINLIPIPALDGGRLLFLAVEAIKGSPIKPKLANALNFLGLILLLALMAVVTYGDIKKLF